MTRTTKGPRRPATVREHLPRQIVRPGGFVRPSVVFRHEWRRFRKERALWFLLALFALSVTFAALNGLAPVVERRESIAFARRDAADKLESLKEYFRSAESPKGQARRRKHGEPPPLPWFSGIVASNWQPLIALPPGPLAPLSVGTSDFQPAVIAAKTAHEQATVSPNDKIENPLNILTGRFDLAFVVVALYPLLIIALGFNLLSGDRENGTLAVSLSQPVPVLCLLWCRALPRALCGLMVVLGPVCVFAPAAGINLAAPPVLWRLLAWTLLATAYGAFWWAVVLAINVSVRSSSTSAMVLSLLWVCTVLVVPAVVGVAVTTFSPTPARVELARAIRSLADTADANRQGLLAAQYRAHPHLVPSKERAGLGDRWTVYWTEEAAVNLEVGRRAEPLLREFEAARARQRSLANRLRFASPALFTQVALSDAAGTGEARLRYFESYASRFQQQWNAFFVPRILRRDSLPETQWHQVPRFTYHEEAAAAVYQRIQWALLSMLLPAFFLGIFVQRRLRCHALAC